ncbi:hypothetical protein GE253_19920 [Niveispirillum sp. SYP-B3756]|uniref:hypothetical protein n=1 Tax=Niveispirillum sp. SYP-B3756 TaxID=2662178 RepID=UPI00129104E8|nr:hypothetical protein [Niveispirillum sp. SYP-B3756]MQP67598.1 hypothetical protein [Niveispirillum sp. SYP-B3756]
MSSDLFRIIDIGLGLILIYMSLSVVVTAMTETIAGLLKLRASTLERGVIWLLQGSRGDPATTASPPPSSLGSIADKVMAHPLINGSASGGAAATIPPRIFALTLLDVLHQTEDAAGAMAQSVKAPSEPGFSFADARQTITKLPDGPLKNNLLLVLADAERRAVAVEDALAQWYDQGMARVSEWYRKRIQRITLVLGILVAVMVNANTIHIAEVLWQDDIARQVTLSAALQASKDAAPGSGCTPVTQPQDDAAVTAAIRCQTGAAMQAFRDVGALPIGWGQNIEDIGRQKGWVTLILGWLLTGFALQMGAPFWFDLLQKLMKMRSTLSATGFLAQGGAQPESAAAPPARQTQSDSTAPATNS